MLRFFVWCLKPYLRWRGATNEENGVAIPCWLFRWIMRRSLRASERAGAWGRVAKCERALESVPPSRLSLVRLRLRICRLWCLARALRVAVRVAEWMLRARVVA